VLPRPAPAIAPPKGRNQTGYWWRRHDEYGKQLGNASRAESKS
jgi:hypothetical protein